MSLLCAKGQSPELDTRTLGKQQTSGYSLVTSRPYKPLQQQWWAFLKHLGQLRLRKGYWQLHLKEGLVLYTVISKEKKSNHSSLYLGMAANLPEEERLKYTIELRKLLTSFIVNTEKTKLQRELQDYERQLSRKSAALEKLRLRLEKLRATGTQPNATMTETMKTLQSELDTLAQQQHSVITQLSVLGD